MGQSRSKDIIHPSPPTTARPVPPKFCPLPTSSRPTCALQGKEDCAWVWLPAPRQSHDEAAGAYRHWAFLVPPASWAWEARAAVADQNAPVVARHARHFVPPVDRLCVWRGASPRRSFLPLGAWLLAPSVAPWQQWHHHYLTAKGAR